MLGYLGRLRIKGRLWVPCMGPLGGSHGPKAWAKGPKGPQRGQEPKGAQEPNGPKGPKGPNPWQPLTTCGTLGQPVAACGNPCTLWQPMQPMATRATRGHPCNPWPPAQQSEVDDVVDTGVCKKKRSLALDDTPGLRVAAAPKFLFFKKHPPPPPC